MKTGRILLMLFVFWLASISWLYAQEIRYLGKDTGVEKGYIEWGTGQYYEVVKGTLISGWGAVTEITDSHLIVQRTLTEAEKERLRSQKLAVYDILQIEIPHDSLRVVPVPVR